MSLPSAPQAVAVIVVPSNGSQEADFMFNRRFVMVGGLMMAGASSSARIALAQSKPMLVFVGHEL